MRLAHQETAVEASLQDAPRDRLGSLAKSALTGALNHLLQSEPWARARLSEHAGKVVRVDVPALALSVVVLPEGRLGIAADGAPADVSLRVPLKALPDLLFGALTAGPQASVVIQKVSIAGDAGLAQDLSFLFQHLRWDVEEDLSRLVGDIAARQTVAGLGAGVARVREINQRIVANASEYLAEEQSTLVTRAHCEGLGAELTALQADLDRLEQRFRQGLGRRS